MRLLRYDDLRRCGRLTGVALAFSMGLAAAARADDPPNSTTIHAASPDGAAVTTVNPDDYPGQSMHVGDLVAASPGTSVLDYGGMLATTTVSIRGASADEVQVVFDGVPLNATSGGGFDLSLIPAALIDSVDVRRGAEGQQYGAGAMGGTVVLEPVSHSRALLTAGSLGTYGASASWVPEPSRWTFLMAGDFRRTSGDFIYQRDATPDLPSDLITFTRQNNDATLGSLLLRAVRAFDSSAKLSVLLWSAGVDRGLPGPIYPMTTPDARQHEAMGLLDVRLETPTGAHGRLGVPVTVRGDIYDAIDSGIQNGDGVQHTIDLSTRPAWRVRLGHWTLGVSGLAGYETLNGPQFGFHSRLRGAIAGDVTWEYGRWTAVAGVREEKWGPAAAFLPRAGGTVRLTPVWTLAANAGFGFRPPSFGELYYTAGAIVPNPLLQPERSRSVDVSVRFRQWGVTAALTPFIGMYQDVIAYETYYSGQTKAFNVGQANAYGGELEVHWRPPFAAIRQLELSGAYTRCETINLDPLYAGNLLPYRPEDRGYVRLSYSRDRWRAAVELRATGRTQWNTANVLPLSVVTDLRGSAGVRLWRSFWLSGEVRNALNQLSSMTVYEYPLPGRVFLAHLSWEPSDA